MDPWNLADLPVAEEEEGKRRFRLNDLVPETPTPGTASNCTDSAMNGWMDPWNLAELPLQKKKKEREDSGRTIWCRKLRCGKQQAIAQLQRWMDGSLEPRRAPVAEEEEEEGKRRFRLNDLVPETPMLGTASNCTASAMDGWMDPWNFAELPAAEERRERERDSD
jgi:hypothetical protein